MTFGDPKNLWLLALAPVAALLGLWLWRRYLRAITRWVGPNLWPRLRLDFSRGRLGTWVILLTLAVGATTLALARPQWGIVPQQIERRGVDTVFVLDSSLSMAVRDVSPSRMTLAKLLMQQLASALHGNRVALVQVEGSGLVLVPLTTDVAVIDLLLDTVSPASLPNPGTALAGALEQSLELFPEGGDKHRVVILLSDGEDHSSDWGEILPRIREAGVVVHTIGIGSEEGGPVPTSSGVGDRYKKDDEGHVVISKLKPETLRRLAAESGGRYLQVENATTRPTEIAAAIHAMEKRTMEGEILEVRAERFQWPLAVAAAALFMLTLISPLRSSKEVQP